MQNNQEPGRSGLSNLRRQQLQPQYSRLAKMLNASLASDSLHSSNAGDLDELQEGDVWEADAGEQESPLDGEPVRKSSNYTHRRDGAAMWGIGDTIRRQRSLEKDPSTAGLPGARMNTYSVSPLQESTMKASGRRSSKEGTGRRIPTSRMIPRSVLSEETTRQALNQSAPMNIPDWSKILKAEKQNKVPIEISDDELEDDEKERLPPHEFLNREYARSQMSSFSVFEGAGRTLRGRDLSRVRNAVLTKTGFLE